MRCQRRSAKAFSCARRLCKMSIQPRVLAGRTLSCNVHYRKSSYNVILYIYIYTHIPALTIRFVFGV